MCCGYILATGINPSLNYALYRQSQKNYEALSKNYGELTIWFRESVKREIELSQRLAERNLPSWFTLAEEQSVRAQVKEDLVMEREKHRWQDRTGL